MIRVEKDFDCPPSICIQYNERLAENSTRLSINRLKQQEKKDLSYKDEEVKAALEELYHCKCAFCETYYDASGYLSIEHFRPKSIYWWLRTEWSNLLPCCMKCNTSKGNKFPLLFGQLNASPPYNAQQALDIKQFRADHLLDEGALLLHPELDQPDDYLAFGIDGQLKALDEDGKGHLSIEVYGLNRLGLIKDRKEAMKKFRKEVMENLSDIVVFSNFYADNQDRISEDQRQIISDKIKEKKDRIQSAIRLSQQAETEYAFVGRYMTRHYETFFVMDNDPNKDASLLLLRKLFKNIVRHVNH